MTKQKVLSAYRRIKCKFQRRFQCFLDFSIDNERGRIRRVVVELRGDVVPKTCENFRRLCTGEGLGYTYKGSMVKRIVKDFVVQMGNAGSSSFGHDGALFPDENFVLRSKGKGDLRMANLGKPNTKCDQFFIVTTDGDTDLDDHFVKFGRVVQGLEHIIEMQKYAYSGGQVTQGIFIENCGELSSPS